MTGLKVTKSAENSDLATIRVGLVKVIKVQSPFIPKLMIPMGFEQLASLKDELARQAAAEKEKQNAEKAAKRAQVDPLIRIIGLLQKNFPAAFPKKPAPKVPLKIGIHKDLLEQAEQLGVNKNEIRAAIKKWCKGRRYSECLIAGNARVDLLGNEAGQVTKEEATQAEKMKTARHRSDPADAATADPAENPGE